MLNRLLLAAWMLASTPVDKIVEASQAEPPFQDLLADLSNELALELEQFNDHSPIAILQVTAGSNLPPQTAGEVQTAVSRAIAKSKTIKETFCFACDSDRGVAGPGGKPASSSGAFDATHLQKLSEDIHARSFLILRLEQEAGEEKRLLLMARLIEPSHGEILLAKIFTSSRRRAALGVDPAGLETSKAREERYASLLRGESRFGHAVLFGMLRIPVKTIIGDLAINGFTLAYRLYDISGSLNPFLFGVQMQGFMDLSFSSQLPVQTSLNVPMSGGLVTLFFLYTLPIDDLRWPRIRLGGEFGAYFGGSLGNNYAAGAMVEVLMLHRLGLNFSLLYIGVSDLSDLFGTKFQLGGVSYLVGGSFNWE